MGPDELTPAEFEGAQQNRYRPRIPWARIGFLVLGVALLVGGYFWRQKVRADDVRERMQALHAAQVEPTLQLLSDARTAVIDHALSAKPGAARRMVATDTPISALHDKRVIYLRVLAPELASSEALAGRIHSEEEDAVGACLGLDLIAPRQLSEVPEVLTADWLAGAEDTNDMMRLSVREEQLTRAIERELPALAALVPADYFLLLVVQGQSRLRDPVDVFLWDLRQDALVLRSRTENRGRLITVRSQIGPKTDARRAQEDPIVTADCSIAAHIKAQLGEPTMELGARD